MKNNVKRKKLRKKKILNKKHLIIGLILVFFITIGFSNLATNFEINGNVIVKKKTWNATEVSYTNDKNTSVTNTQEAIEDLYTKFGK